MNKSELWRLRDIERRLLALAPTAEAAAAAAKAVVAERDRLAAENAALKARWERLNVKLRGERLASLDRPVEGYTDGLDNALYMMAALEREEQHGESR